MVVGLAAHPAASGALSLLGLTSSAAAACAFKAGCCPSWTAACRSCGGLRAAGRCGAHSLVRMSTISRAVGLSPGSGLTQLRYRSFTSCGQSCGTESGAFWPREGRSPAAAAAEMTARRVGQS